MSPREPTPESEQDPERIAAERRLRELEQEVHALQRRSIRLEDELRQLRARRSVKAALRLASWFRPIIKLYRRWRGRRAGGGRSTSSGGPASGRRATEQEQGQLSQRLIEAITGMPAAHGPAVSLVIVNRHGEEHLRRLMPALLEVAYRPLEVIVVDNASTDTSISYLEGLSPPWDLRIVRNRTNKSFSEANNEGVRVATGELLLFLNNDVQPLEPGWLGRMVARILSDPLIAAVGARLVYPARPRAEALASDDLTLQHRGIHFVPGDGYPRPVNMGTGEDPLSADAGLSREVPAVTAACALVRRDVFERVGGFDLGYQYGTEDVDLCLKIREAGSSIWYEASAVLYHYEFGTQGRIPREVVRRNRMMNRRRFIDRWGPRLYREVFEDRLAVSGRWSHDPLHVAITVTRDDADAGYGDYFTAHELGEELVRFGWRVSYVEQYRDRWYELPAGTDVVLVLLDGFDIDQVSERPVTVAWVRNWVDRWLDRPWFDAYDLVLASSRTTVEIIEQRSTQRAHLFPLATNAQRFRSGQPREDLRCDVLFAGNRWERPRAVEGAIEDFAERFDVRVYGSGWDDTPLQAYTERRLPYEDLPSAYASAGVVLDDTAEHAKPFGSVNSRVFDALAAGRPVVTDNAVGVEELFDEHFPTYETPGEAEALVDRFLTDDEWTARFLSRYRHVVLERHTYEMRAEALREHLKRWADARKFALMTSVPDRESRRDWGDWYFARDLQNALQARGYPTTVHVLDEAEAEHSARADSVVHLFGRSEFRTRPSQVSAIWVISHPADLTPELCRSFEIVFVAGRGLRERLGSELDRPVVELHQATDPERFTPRAGPHHELLFVGNSRGVKRKIVRDLLPTSRDLSVYGQGWTRDLLPRRYLRGGHVPNDELAGYYASADIVLNDHWEDMRENQMFSNRLYDALAAGAFVISDHVQGMDEEFENGVITYQDPDELGPLIERYLADPEARKAIAARGRRAVLDRHTFDSRVAAMMEQLLPLLGERRL